MKQFLCAAILIAAASFPLSAIEEVLVQADELDTRNDHSSVIELLSDTLPTVSAADERAEVLWRLSRAMLGYGDEQEEAGASESELLDIFQQGEDYGAEAVESNPDIVEGYFWQSGNIGRWGQTKGVLDSLFRASEMRDILSAAIEIDSDHADSYFVLSQLYAAVPGFISFGNSDYAVSLARKSIVLMEDEVADGQRDSIAYDFYNKLAEALAARGWSQRKRDREHSRKAADYREADTPLEQGWYYEGTISIPPMSDQSEAEMLLNDVILQIERMPEPGEEDQTDLETARELLESL
ncbi:MAG: hypothetical protein ACOCVC_05170 [Spirochaeta sp.]